MSSLEAAFTTEVGAVVEHAVSGGVKGPESALSGSFLVSWNLDETVVETEVVTDGVLPTLLILAVVGKSKRQMSSIINGSTSNLSIILEGGTNYEPHTKTFILRILRQACIVISTG